MQTSNDATLKTEKKMTLWNVWSPTVVQELIEVIKESSNITLSVSHKTMQEKIYYWFHTVLNII